MLFPPKKPTIFSCKEVDLVNRRRSRPKELIAVGISVVIDCEFCMQWHIEQAAKAGASMGEVLEAVEVSIEMGGGPATASARFALEVMETVLESKKKRR